MFSFAQGSLPRYWREMSLEYKWMVVYHSVMLLMLVGGGLLTVEIEVAIAALVVASGIILSLRHRQQVGWRWPQTRPNQRLIAAGAIVVGVIFLGSSVSMFSPLEPHALPWYLAGGGIVTFNVLHALRLVTVAEADFVTPSPLEANTAPESTPGTTDKPWWHRPIRLVCVELFMAAWLNMAAFIYFFGQAFEHGSTVPTATQNERLQNHGTSIYVTSAEKARLDWLELGQAGIPVSIALMAFCHFVLGIKLFANAPTLAELRQRTRNPAFAGSTLEGPVRICSSCGLRNIQERQTCKRCGAELGPIDATVP